MKLNQSKKGFTLVEIMIVVVIIGLLAAMAIPAFNKVRSNSIKSTMDNDARQLVAAFNQYIMENNVTQVATSLIVGTESSHYVKGLSKNNTATGTLTLNTSFSISNTVYGTASYMCQ